MGLDFSHCDAHWTYSGFNRFRERLCAEIGVDLHKMRGFCEEGGISWSTVDHPLVEFFDHSDCEGALSVEQLKEIAPAILLAIKNWDESDFDKRMANELVEGMQAAIKQNEKMRFF